MQTQMTQTTQTTELSTFQHYYERAVKAYKENPRRATYINFSNKTLRATRPLTSAHELQFYTVAYAMAHYKSLMAAFEEEISFTGDEETYLNIVDYGCGQGLATLTFLDFMVDKVNRPIYLNVHLLEPSEMALNVAKDLIEARANELGMNITISSQCTHIDEIELPEHIKHNSNRQYVTLHLFSNVLDIDGVQKALWLVESEIRKVQGSNIIVASGPRYSGSFDGFQILSNLLTGKNYWISHHNVEHESYDVCDYNWATQIAKRSYMILGVKNHM